MFTKVFVTNWPQVLSNTVQKSLFTLCKVVQQQLLGEVGKFINQPQVLLHIRWSREPPLTATYIILVQCSAENQLDCRSECFLFVTADGGVEKTAFGQRFLQHREHLELLVRLQSQNLLHHLLRTDRPAHQRTTPSQFPIQQLILIYLK